ncbi:MAG: hypothetical protein ACJLTB_00630 [Algoriphagus aquaeductus]|uniref:hypothetical protein n=1 Tax=Algoriphagus aquaeductus TaxID=475299 RepID=UPI0038797762
MHLLLEHGIRHFDFSLSLRNSFGESLGFNRSGSGDYKYESVEESDLIKPNSTYELYFSPKNIEDFNRFYSQHGERLKGSIFLNFVKFNNNEEFSSHIYSTLGLRNRTFDDIERVIKSEQDKYNKLVSYF